MLGIYLQQQHTVALATQLPCSSRCLSLPAVATGATTLQEPFGKALLPFAKKMHEVLNERLFDKGIRTDFSSVMTMAVVVGLIAVTSSIA